MRAQHVLVLWASRLLNTWICFQIKLPLVLSEREKENRAVLVVSQYSTPAQDTIFPLLLKSKGLSVGSFLWALFQICLGPGPGVGSEV